MTPSPARPSTLLALLLAVQALACGGEEDAGKSAAAAGASSGGGAGRGAEAGGGGGRAGTSAASAGGAGSSGGPGAAGTSGTAGSAQAGSSGVAGSSGSSGTGASAGASGAAGQSNGGGAGAAGKAGAALGTYERPFGDRSLWNARPVKPVLGSFEIPLDKYFPVISGGDYSTGIYQAKPTDPPQTIMPRVGQPGVWDPDAERARPSVTVAHWPSGTDGAVGTDGHCDIIDEAAGVIHSFWQLKNDNGVWRAQQWAWAPLAGTGWGTPAHYLPGARAAGVPTSAGMIRKHEMDDGEALFRHALAMSLTYSGLSAAPTYVFPATSADGDAAKTNKGKVPEGALMMLPASFDTSKMPSANLRKVAETLKTYGARVVDRNDGTPFAIYVENGKSFCLGTKCDGSWENPVASALQTIRGALRVVESSDGYLDPNGVAFTPTKKLNVFSMRGPWRVSGGPELANVFDSLSQAVAFPTTDEVIEWTNTDNSAHRPRDWEEHVDGKTYTMRVTAKGGATIKLAIIGSKGEKLSETAFLGDGATAKVVFPTWNPVLRPTIRSGVGGPSSVGMTLIED